MDNEQLLEQFAELLDKCHDLRDRRLCRSGLKMAMEAKRFAKTHRLLAPYLRACWGLLDCALYCFESEIGIDQAMEIIALTESEEKAKKFQNDFGTDQDQYTAAWTCLSGYSYLAMLTATQNGYNSQLVHGALDDGIHVCRRRGMVRDLDHFWVFAVYTSLAAGDYEMGEHYARLVLSTRDSYDYCGYDLLGEVYMLQGKLGAAFEVLRASAPMAKTFHNLLEAEIRLAHQTELFCLISGREAELPELLNTFGFPNGIPEIPSREENAYHHFDQTVNDALRHTLHGEYAEAESILVAEERFLLAQDNLNRWFSIRIQRIANRFLATESGDNSFSDTDRLAEELRSRASKVCEWSAIQSLDTMLHRTVRLNPLGIAFPIDIGLYATEGTPISHAQIQLTLPLLEKTADVRQQTAEKKEKSPLELEIASWLAPLKPLWEEAAAYGKEETPFPKAEELAAMEQELLDKILSLTPEALTEDEFMEAEYCLQHLRHLHDVTQIEKIWKWVKRMVAHFPDRGRPLAALADQGFRHRATAANANVEPASLGLPEPAEIEKWIADAFEKEPNRTGIATAAGKIFRAHGNNREAQRYFSRATQIDRLNGYATGELAELYYEADRSQDALAAIELYTRAGGRSPRLLWLATQIAFNDKMPQEFLTYYSAYTELQPPSPKIDAQCVWALCRTARWNEALKMLDQLDDGLENLARDRLFVRALCQAELGDESWLATIDQALCHTECDAEGLVGSAFDPSEMLWHHLRSDTGKRRERFEQFLFERNLVPNDFFEPDVPTDDEELPERNLYSCHLKQPLNPEIPAYAGWVQIPSEDMAYIAVWFVVADTPEEATALALAAQARCYPLVAECVECEHLDSYVSKYPQVLVQGKRYKETTD